MVRRSASGRRKVKPAIAAFASRVLFGLKARRIGGEAGGSARGVESPAMSARRDLWGRAHEDLGLFYLALFCHVFLQDGFSSDRRGSLIALSEMCQLPAVSRPDLKLAYQVAENPLRPAVKAVNPRRVALPARASGIAHHSAGIAPKSALSRRRLLRREGGCHAQISRRECPDRFTVDHRQRPTAGRIPTSNQRRARVPGPASGQACGAL